MEKHRRLLVAVGVLVLAFFVYVGYVSLGIVENAPAATAIASAVAEPKGVAPRSSPKEAPFYLEAFIAAYGRPDADDSTAYDNPRPPIVTRWLSYRRQNVRVMYIQRGRVGDQPPYEWTFLAFQDAATDAVLSRAEATERMARIRIP
jgi:hypothetical protein